MYKVGIIGIGSISEGYGAPDSPTSYCHTGGILYSDRVELAAVADLDPERHERFREKWGEALPDVAHFDSADAMFAGAELDIVAVCVRGPAHFDVTSRTIEAGPQSIFLEKPPTCSLDEMDRIRAAAGDIPITVSYSRHWAPHVLRLQELVNNGLIGEVQTVVGFTGGTFLSFASHTTDLICQFAGYCPKTVLAHGSPGADAPDGYEPEPKLEGVVIEFANGRTGIHVGHTGEHGGFYCDVFGTEGHVRAGMYIPPFAADKDGKEIDLAAHGMPEDSSVFTVAYAQIADYLDGGDLPDCTDADFASVHEIGFASIESMMSGQRIAVPVANRQRKVFANG